MLTRFLARASVPVFTAYAVAMAFTTYFCMYAFRKPWAAGHYEGDEVGGMKLKGALVIAQVAGYALSKIAGIKVNSEMPAARRRAALVVLVLVAQAALVLFAVVPPPFKLAALFLNGLPLGAVWGLVFSFLEGRKTSELLGAGLSCAYIVASGFVKSAGQLALQHGVSESWMPALVGAAFLPLFVLAVWGLSQLPPPSEADARARVARVPMYAADRRAFLRRYAPGMALLCVTYFFLTAYRDFRDNFAVELWRELGNGGSAAVMTTSEVPVALAVMVGLGLVYLVDDNRRALLVTYGLMVAGSFLIGAGTLAFDAGAIGGTTWMMIVGTGLYLAYVPFGCVLFDRLIAVLGAAATAVFLIYVADAVGYVGSVAVVLYKQLGEPSATMLDFFRRFSYATAALGVVGFAVSGAYFLRRRDCRQSMTKDDEVVQSPEPIAAS